MIRPDAMSAIASRIINNTIWLNIQAALALLFGLYMSYMGYIA